MNFVAVLATCVMSAVPGSAQTWTAHSIGTVTSASCTSGSTMTVNGSAGNLSDKQPTDNYEFCATPESGNFMLIARVATVGSSTTAGIQVREDLTSGSRNEMIYAKANGTVVSPGTNRREFTGAAEH